MSLANMCVAGPREPLEVDAQAEMGVFGSLHTNWSINRVKMDVAFTYKYWYYIGRVCSECIAGSAIYECIVSSDAVDVCTLLVLNVSVFEWV